MMIRSIFSTTKSQRLLKKDFVELPKDWHFYSTLPPLLQNPFHRRLRDKAALIDENGHHSYGDLISNATKLSKQLVTSRRNLDGERIAILTPNNASYIIAKWAAWLAGGICVPLCKSHPPAELSYVLNDSEPRVIITTPEYSDVVEELVRPIGANLITILADLTHNEPSYNEVSISKNNHALIVYTSGTTGPPKGVLWTHTALQTQIDMMVQAWNWTENDNILHVLPLHHVHGIINALFCPLSIGATVIMTERFIADQVWSHFLGNIDGYPDVSVFMAVPTIYAKLLEYYDNNLVEKSEEILAKCQDIRLMVSGSASLPKPVFKKWQEVTSHLLLERYGMTEIGMALTNPYREDKRIPGSVGKPFPRIQAKITDDKNQTIAIGDAEAIEENVKGQQGELQIKGPIFERYWKNNETTRKSFSEDGWFKTGDTATIEDGCFKIVGRTSVDIIKSGGYKIGALHVERHLLEHEKISDVAVLGVPDQIWGERVGAVISLKSSSDILSIEDLKLFCQTRIPTYAAPTVIKIVESIPKNTMGKVNKKELVQLFR